MERYRSAITVIVVISLLVMFFNFSVGATEPSVVSVSPSSQIVGPQDTFTIDVSCVPGQPIKSFELKFSFDASLVMVDSVSEGDIFNGYTTYFNSGTIDNVAGTVEDIYGLILGPGNVSSNGTLVGISITSKSTTGISSLNLYDVGLTNETEYVSVSINNGSVQVDATAPQIVDNCPSSGTTGDEFTFNASVTDNIDDADELTVKVAWEHGWKIRNQTMTQISGNYFERTGWLATNSTSDLTYSIYAVDTYGNCYTTSIETVSVSDNDNPNLILDNSDSSGTTGDSYSFDVTVSDNVGIGGVNASWSHDSLGGNLALSNDGDGTWSGSITLENSLDNLVYRIQVNDTSGNYVRGSQKSKSVNDNDDPQISGLSTTPSAQDIGGYVNISGEITDNIAINSIYMDITYPDSGSKNISIIGNNSGDTYYCNQSYNIPGTYYYYIWVDDSSGNSVSTSTDSFTVGELTLPQISNIIRICSDPLDTNSTYGWVNISCTVIDDKGVNSVSLNITKPDGSYNNVSMNTAGGNIYCYNTSTSFSTYGNYSYLIWAKDTSWNENTSDSVDFSMPPNWDIDMNGECKVYDLTLLSNHYGEMGAPGWIREDVDNNGEVEILDFVYLSAYYNQVWWV